MKILGLKYTNHINIKIPISMDDIDINKIVISNKIHNEVKKILKKRYSIFRQKMSMYGRYFLIIDENIFDKNNKTFETVSYIIKKKIIDKLCIKKSKR